MVPSIDGRSRAPAHLRYIDGIVKEHSCDARVTRQSHGRGPRPTLPRWCSVSYAEAVRRRTACLALWPGWPPLRSPRRSSLGAGPRCCSTGTRCAAPRRRDWPTRSESPSFARRRRQALPVDGRQARGAAARFRRRDARRRQAARSSRRSTAKAGWTSTSGIMRRVVDPVLEKGRLPNSLIVEVGRSGLDHYLALMLAFLGRRVLGQYDPQLMGVESIDERRPVPGRDQRRGMGPRRPSFRRRTCGAG